MNRMTTIAVSALTGLLLCACGGGARDVSDEAAEQTVAKDTPAVTFAQDEEFNVTTKPGGPVRIEYRIIGTPIVGQPVTVDLRVSSNIGDRAVSLSYRSTDTTAMTFPETQSSTVPLALDEERTVAQQVTVIPQREGRLYLNVTAEIETGTGSLATVTAIPIQVGSAAREPEQDGTVTTDEEGGLIRTMQGEDG